jgi:RNA polymerase sigma-70 factor (ECF subfamily)
MERQQQLMAEFVATRHALFAFIYGFTRNPHDAEDLFQEVWLRFSRALAEGTEIQEQAKWCRATARNLLLHYWRDRRHDAVPVDPELLELVDQAFAEQSASQESWRLRQEALSRCVEELPDRARELLRLKYDESLSAGQVADRLRQSTAAVLMSLSRVRKALRDCAQRKLKAEGLAP